MISGRLHGDETNDCDESPLLQNGINTSPSYQSVDPSVNASDVRVTGETEPHLTEDNEITRVV